MLFSLKFPKHLEVCKSHWGKSLTNTFQLFFLEPLKSMNLLFRSIMFIMFRYRCIFQWEIFFLRLGLLLFLCWAYGKVSVFLIFGLCSAHLKSRTKLKNICHISWLLISSTSGVSSGRKEKHPRGEKQWILPCTISSSSEINWI